MAHLPLDGGLNAKMTLLIARYAVAELATCYLVLDISRHATTSENCARPVTSE